MMDIEPDESGRFRALALGDKYKIMKLLAESGSDFQEELARNRFYFREQSVAHAVACRDPAHWSHVKQGKQPTSAAQLKLLAKYFKLDAESYLGPTAWEVFRDTTTVAEFQARLMNIGYGYYAESRRASDPVRALFDDLAPFSPSLQGLDIECVAMGPNRGIADEEPDPEIPVVNLRERSEVRLHVSLERPAHVVLLDCAPGDAPQGLEVTALAPSARARTTPLPAGATIPTESNGPKRVFYIAPPPQRHHLLAFVSAEPLPLSWPQPERGFAVLTPNELGCFLASVKKAGPERVKVLHRPYRVIAD